MVDKKRIDSLSTWVADKGAAVTNLVNEGKDLETGQKTLEGNLKWLEGRAKKIKFKSKYLKDIAKLHKTRKADLTKFKEMAKAAQGDHAKRRKLLAQLVKSFDECVKLEQKGGEKETAKAEALKPNLDVMADQLTKELEAAGPKLEKLHQSAKKRFHKLGTEIMILESKADKEIADAEKAAKKK